MNKQVGLAMMVLLVASPSIAQIGDESGITKKHRFSAGFYTVGSANSFDDSIIKSTGQNEGVTLKFDKILSRPSRHETLLSYQYFHDVLRVGGGSMLFLEHRWRFDKFGRAYYGINLGAWRLHEGGSETKRTSGSVIGYHPNEVNFIELRYSQLSTDASFTSLMIGRRL